jgi:hypothetical protein
LFWPEAKTAPRLKEESKATVEELIIAALRTLIAIMIARARSAGEER